MTITYGDSNSKMFYTLVNLFSYADSEERFNDLQTKLQELEVRHQSPKEFYRTATPSSRDSGIPVRSSSSCCSLTSESASTPKSSIEHPFERPISQSPQTSVLHFYLHPPTSNRQQRHVSVHLDDETTGMSYIHDTVPNYQSQGRNVHWNDQDLSQQTTQSRRSSSQHVDDQYNFYNSDSNIIKTNGQRISLNASLPYDSKLNIRIHADRKSSDNNISQVKAIATVEPLDNAQYEQEYYNSLQNNYLEHYSTTDDMQTTISSPIQRREKLPRHRQVSLPVSLPVDQRIYLYIQNGEVLARC